MGAKYQKRTRENGVAHDWISGSQPVEGSVGLPQWLSGKESACSTRDPGDADSIPELERSPGGGNDNPLQYSCLENSMDSGAWRATVHGVTESDMTEQLTLSLSDYIDHNNNFTGKIPKGNHKSILLVNMI